MPTDFSFQLLGTDGAARTGEIRMPRGVIRTPAFMPVGTAATVKGMYPEQVKALGADVVLGNTYHLMLRPGAERVAKLGGLHKFMNWPHPILTDSGGFQVMSLAQLRKLNENGVIFQSHIDGSRHEMTPERSIEIQNLLGSDIVMQLDECVALPCEDSVAEKAMQLSLRWAERCRVAFGDPEGRALFAIVQGAAVPALRVQSAKALVDMGFRGYAIGGLAVGEPQDVMLAMIETVMPHLPDDKPHYLMGVGTPDDIIEAVKRGIDMFDCVMPTRAGRHGQIFTRFGRMNMRNAKHAEDARPIDVQSSCPAARDYSRAYLHHLMKAEEMLGKMLLTWVNLAYYQDLMAGLRQAIAAKKLDDFVAATREGWARGDVEA
ncbi:MAG: tRNA guanosine(34) transglycosylase Tgt [Bosea sp. (in: a-proteobacteria)]